MEIKLKNNIIRMICGYTVIFYQTEENRWFYYIFEEQKISKYIYDMFSFCHREAISHCKDIYYMKGEKV